VDTDNFGYDPGARSLLRSELGLDTDERLLVYVGKIGPRYLVEETFRFFRVVRERLSTARLLILTGDRAAEFRQAAARAGVDEAHYHVRRADPSEVSKWLSASDAGLAFIRKTDCERASSPIKVGEYLAVGLPVVITGGIGDYSDLIAVKRLGAVVNELGDADYVKCVDHLNALWAEGNQLRERCRAVAESYVSLKSVGAPRYQAVYEELLTSKTSAAPREREVGV
jgi:glycosyltransferase involved in cell wall biosynthesis